MNRLIIAAIVVLGLYMVSTRMTAREGFSYGACRGQGYTKEFCEVRPWPGVCRCPNGLTGRILPGFGGACVCSPFVTVY